MPRYDDDDDYDDRPRRRPRRDDDEDYDDRPRSRRRDDEDDYDDRPRRRRRPEGNPAAAISLTLGLLSILLNVLTGIPAIILGVVGMKKAGRYGPGRGMAVGGIVSGVLGMIVSGVGIYFFWNVGSRTQTAAERARITNNLKQIGLGMHNFHDANWKFPAAYTTRSGVGQVADQAVPVDQRFMSWRTAILPYVEQGRLFQGYDQQQPWNSPRNRPVTDTVVPTYTNGRDQTTQTRFAVFTGPNTPFRHVPKPLGMANFTDGASNTILMAESATLRPWGEPTDMEVSPTAAMPQLGDPAKPTFCVLMADGSVRQVRQTIDERTLRLLVDPADGQAVPFDW